MPETFVKLFRSINNSEIKRHPNKLAVWIDLLVNASWNPYTISFGGKTTEIAAGELLTGRKELAERTGLPMSTVEDSLRWLETRQQIRQRTCTKGRIITIVNWDKWQKSDSESDSDPTATRQRPDTIKEYKNLRREEKKERIPLSPLAPNCEFFRISEQELAQAQTRYRTNGYPVELIPVAIEVIEGWLAGDTPAAIKARKLPTHYRRLYADWVVQKAVQMRDTKASANGNGHRPRGEYKSRFERQQEILKKQLIKEMQNGNFSTNDSTLDATFNTIPLLPVGRGDH